MTHPQRSKKAQANLPGYEDHWTAVRLIAEKYKMDPKEVDAIVRFFFRAGFRRAIIHRWTLRITNFCTLRPAGNVLRMMRHRLKKEAKIRIVNKKNRLN
jgi:hypothetical protein